MSRVILKKFSVRNYRNFKSSFTIDFSDVMAYDFGQQCISENGKYIKNAIIYGRNAAGKSNFSYALMDITYHLIDAMRDKNAFVSYINGDAEAEIAEFEYIFMINGKELRYYYTKSSPTSLCQEELLVDNRIIFSCDHINKKILKEDFATYGLETLNWQFWDNGISILRYIANNSNLASSHFIIQLMRFVKGMLLFCSFGVVNKYVGYSTKQELLAEYIINEGYVTELQEFLFDYGVEEKLVVEQMADGSKVLCFAHKKNVPLQAASKGTIALITFFYWMKHIKDLSFLIIDEFDAFYHFEVAERLVKMLEKKFAIQIVITSHNTNLLSNKIMRPDCYFILTGNKLVSFARATSRELHEGHNLEKLFMSGEFDG